MKTLTTPQKHLLKLAHQGRDSDGWSAVSSAIMPLLSDLPDELVTVVKLVDGSGRAKLTDDGRAVIMWG